MNKVEIVMNGKAYPCRPSMGAMLLFKRETGREATELQADSISDLFTFLWCCIRTASRHDGLDFSMTLEEFADATTPDQALTWFNAFGRDVAADTSTGADGGQQPGTDGGPEKKTGA